MNILITGSAGFIGYNYSKYILNHSKHKVIGFDNLNDYYAVKIKKNRIKDLKKYKNFEFFKGDLKKGIK